MPQAPAVLANLELKAWNRGASVANMASSQAAGKRLFAAVVDNLGKLVAVPALAVLAVRGACGKSNAAAPRSGPRAGTVKTPRRIGHIQ